MSPWRRTTDTTAAEAPPVPRRPTVDELIEIADSYIRTRDAIRALPEHSCDGHTSGRLKRVHVDTQTTKLRAEIVCDVCGEVERSFDV